MPMKFDTMFLE